VHEGSFSSHIGGRPLARRIITQGYWWPTLAKDAVAYVKRCDKCQRFSNIPHQPHQPMTSISSPWPFTVWGIDLVGPLPRAANNYRFLIVATDYFSKWVEAEPMITITEQKTFQFIWKNIIYRHSLPNTLISDNGTQFKNSSLEKYSERVGVK